MDSSKIKNILAYPTHILVYEWENSESLNVALREKILKKEKEDPGLKQSNSGGYHSDWDLLSWGGEEIGVLVKRITELSRVMLDLHGLEEDKSINLNLVAWANIVRSGNYHVPHIHPKNHWSGVYYVSDGNPDQNIEHNGSLEFLDPRPGAELTCADSVTLTNRYFVTPTPGAMILFPSYLQHFVHPYVGEGERISIAFNVNIP